MASTYIGDPESFDARGATGVQRSASSLVLQPFGRTAGVIALLVALCASLWGIAEYAEHKAEIRRAETDRYIQAFETGPIAGAWAMLRRAWDTPGAHSYGLRAEALDSALEAEIGIVLGHFRGFALCVRAGNCDAERARLYLGDLPGRFRQQHLDHLEENFADVPFDRDLEVLMPKDDIEPLWP